MFGQLVDLQAAGLRCLVVALITRILDSVMNGALVLFQVALFAGNIKTAVTGKADKIFRMAVLFVALESDGRGRDVAALVAEKVHAAMRGTLVQL